MNNLLLGSNSQFFKLPFPDFVEAERKNEISAIDLVLMAPHIYVDSVEWIDVVGVAPLLKEHGIKVSHVTPLPYRYSICSEAGSYQNDRTLEYYKQCMQLAASFGAKTMGITASGADYDQAKDCLMENAATTLRKLMVWAEEYGITLLLGCVLGEESPYNASTPVLVTLAEVKDMLKRVNSPYLKAYLDVEPASLKGESITHWFAELGQDIGLVRFTDGNYNGYRIWGMGCLPCERFLLELKQAGYTGPISTQIPGERYSGAPQENEAKHLAYLRAAMEKVG